jgi:uncharacterized membrane protein
MYLLDPSRGKRRRALARDKAAHLWRRSESMADKTGRDVAHRVRGIASTAGGVFRKEQVSGDVLAARVRSKLGRLVSHPGSIEVQAQDDGTVILSGPVLAREVHDLLTGVSKIRGVTRVENRLEEHREAGDVPGLQGGPAQPPRRRFELMQENWTPAARVLVGAAGGALAFYGARQRHAAGIAAGVLGAGMLARSISNMEAKRLLGIRAGRRAVDVQKTINVNTPVEEVFNFWTRYENFPRIMSHLREVRDLGNERSHWVAAGPMGVPVEWDAEITEFIPNQVLAWKSTPGATVRNAGIIRFDRNPDGSTRVHMRISYNPPAGAVGHAVASLFGADFKHAIDEDLVRLKSLLEEGKTTAHDRTVSREELAGARPGEAR